MKILKLENFFKFFVLLFLTVALNIPVISYANESGNIFSIQFENDIFGGGTDRHFTHGTRLQLLTEPIDWISEAAGKLPWFSREKSLEGPENMVQARTSISIGQSIFTPDNINETDLIKRDRPYAGWLYLGLGIVANQGTRRFDQLELNVGMIGPSSRADQVQIEFHELFGFTEPRGWDNQLEDEPGIVLFYEQTRRFEKRRWVLGLQYDFMPHFGGSIGNVYTLAKTGFTVRVGDNLVQDFGPPRIRPSLPGAGVFIPQKGFNWYFFAGAEGRLVLRNIFLDGNTFEDSHNVDKKLIVGDLQLGLALQYNRFRFSFTQIFRTKEFNHQDRPDRFGAFSFSYQF